MTWTNYSTTDANNWSADIGSSQGVTSHFADTSLPPDTGVFGDDITAALVNNLSSCYNVPGYDDGYQPIGVLNPIGGSFGGGGGGSVRPASGMLYPRGQG